MRCRTSYQRNHVLVAALAFAVAAVCCCGCCQAFVAVRERAMISNAANAASPFAATAAARSGPGVRGRPLLYNIYDSWRSDAVVDTMHLDEDNVRACLEEFVNSDYGTTMFGCHARPSSFGITGRIDFVEICGPEVTLSLEGRFWHRRSTVLGRAAMWLNARIPEITDVMVADLEDLEDFEEIKDERSGDVLFRKDKRSEDFNGDRATMEYQGLDPDARGPFPASPMGSGGSMINPA